MSDLRKFIYGRTLAARVLVPMTVGLGCGGLMLISTAGDTRHSAMAGLLGTIVFALFKEIDDRRRGR